MGNILFKELREQFLSHRSDLKGEGLSLTFSVRLNPELKTAQPPGKVVMKFDVPDGRFGKSIPIFVLLSDPKTKDSMPDDDTEDVFLDLCGQAGELIPQREADKLDEWIHTATANYVGRSIAHWLTWLFDGRKSIPEGDQWSHCAFTIEDVFMVSAEKLRKIKGGTHPVQGKRSTVKGEAREKIIAGLTEHHNYDGGSCLNCDPINLGRFATKYQVGKSTVSEFLRDQFEGFPKYRTACHSPRNLAAALKQIRGEIPASALLGRRPEPARDEADET